MRDSKHDSVSTDPREQEPIDVSRRGLTNLLGLLGGAVALSACKGATEDAQGDEPTGTAYEGISYASATVVDTLASLRALVPTNINVVFLEGRNWRGDGGGGTFLWQAGAAPKWPSNPTVPIPDDGGILAVSTAATGYWLRVDPGPFNALWFGAQIDNSSFDSAPAIQAAIDAAAYSHALLNASGAYAATTSARGGVVLLPKGRYYIASTILLSAARYGNILEGVALEGDAGNQSNSLATLAWSGATSAPMLKVIGALACRVTRVGFWACTGVGAFASHCLQVTTVVSPGVEITVSNFTVRECSFSGAAIDNVLLGEPDANAPGNQDIQNATFHDCSFTPSNISGANQPRTVSHVRQRGGNIVATAIYGARFNGSMIGEAITQTGDYFPLHAIKINSGWMKCYAINAAALGFCDIYADSAGANSFGGSLEVFGWDSQSMNFFMSNQITGTSGALPILFSGVHHSDVYNSPPALPATFPAFVAPTVSPTQVLPYRFSVDFNCANAQPLTMSGCVFTRDVVFRAAGTNASIHGVTFLGVVTGANPRPYGVVGPVDATEGSWRENSSMRSQLPNGTVLLNPSTAGVNQIEGKYLSLGAFGTATDTVALGGASLCGYMFVVLNNGSGGVGGTFYLASGLPTPSQVTSQPFGFMSNTNPAAANNALNLYWDAAASQFKIRNGFSYTCAVRLSLIGFGVH